MKKAIICGLVFLLGVTVWAGFELASDASAIYDGTIRLHILAASDSEEDQALKLTVRDALLTKVAELTECASDKKSGEAVLAQHLDELKAVAEDALSKAGCEDSVAVSLTTEYYPTREYDNLRLPAGEYTSLQVKIGKAEGKNWWCILFPPVCTSSAKAEEAMAETGFTKNQIRLLTEEEEPQYTLRFRIVEEFAKIRRTLKGLFE